MPIKLPTLENAAGRRAWAFLAICGGAMAFSVFIWVSLYLLRDHAGFIFWLALAAHAQVLVGMTALGWAMGRRVNISVTKTGATVDDTAHAEQDVADEAQEAADRFKG